jgi:transketolase
MLVGEARLHKGILDATAREEGATRDGFGKGVVEAGERDHNVVVLCADLAESTRSHWFKEKFPDRYIELGVAEQNLAGVASGMASMGKVPFITSYAAFNPGRNNEQIRTTIALNEQPVVVCGMHAGLSVGPDGATHQALEDVALMRVIPNMTVIVPSDMEEARKATLAAATSKRPMYLRFARENTPLLTTKDTPFEIGKAYRVWQGNAPTVGIIAMGSMVYQAIQAAVELETRLGISSVVLSVHTIKPLDTDAIVALANETNAILTVEEHQVIAGLGGAVAETLSLNRPTKMAFVGVQNRFGQSGTTQELYTAYGLDVPSIIQKAISLTQA